MVAKPRQPSFPSISLIDPDPNEGCSGGTLNLAHKQRLCTTIVHEDRATCIRSPVVKYASCLQCKGSKLSAKRMRMHSRPGVMSEQTRRAGALLSRPFQPLPWLSELSQWPAATAAYVTHSLSWNVHRAGRATHAAARQAASFPAGSLKRCQVSQPKGGRCSG